MDPADARFEGTLANDCGACERSAIVQDPAVDAIKLCQEGVRS